MKILECSSRGDKRFSAFYAYITVFGVYKPIEVHYQMSKRFPDKPSTPMAAKGRKPTHFEVAGIKLPLKLFGAWYDLLWVKYLDNNPDLVAYAKQFDDFSDMFKGKSMNCQADSIRRYIKGGRRSIMSHPFVIELIDLIKKGSV